MTITATNQWSRQEHLARLSDESPFDVLVIGGGVTGAGAALDLGLRGARVALVEQADFAQGTSSRSTKLFHGGIRYLPHFEFGLVAEGLREQKVLARIADFLYQPLEFIIPIYEQYGLADAPEWAARGWRAPLALRAGLILYDVLGGPGRPGGRHHRLDARQLASMLPTLRTEGLKGGFAYTDAQTDDARLVVSLVKTAVRRHGVVAAQRIRVERVTPQEESFQVELTDHLTGERLTVHSRGVLAATGAFTPPGIDGRESALQLVRSKGIHLIIPPEVLQLGDRALVLPETDDGRVLFIIPWLGHSMIGTTDTPYREDPTHPTATASDVEYLIRHVRRYLEVGDFEPLSTFAGLRALADTGAGSTAKASREHVISEPIPGYVQVAGGKLTTYRRIAAEAADRVAARMGMSGRSITDQEPLVGAGGARSALERRLTGTGIPATAVGPTIDRYGTEAEMLARLVEENPSWATPLSDGRTTLADVVYAARYEAASRLSDVTLRRTHLAWFTPDHARGDAPEIARVLGEELGWSTEQREAELQAHDRELAAEGL